MVAELPRKVRNAAATPREKVRRRKNPRSNIGLENRSSHQMNVSSKTRKLTPAARIGRDNQPMRWALEIAIRRTNNAREDNEAPSQSNPRL